MMSDEEKDRIEARVRLKGHTNFSVITFNEFMSSTNPKTQPRRSLWQSVCNLLKKEKS